ncbi:MAG: pyrroline-5-carboxylate reductase [Candidatus Omnitrophica bacterium]|nr:pyrroline-5-carboxylate reductase [Candidatus Omnitrophota bacterium]
MNRRIGIIGFGNMGSSMAYQLKADYQIHVFDKDNSKLGNLPGDIRGACGIADLVNRVNTVILAVKPQEIDAVLDEVKPVINDRLIISIAAGISTEYIEKALGIVRVIRAMPNMPAKIGEGTTCLSRGRYSTEEDFDFAQDLFLYLGETIRIEEKMMNAATAISGSGPGYCYDMLESHNIETADINAVRKFVKDFFIPQLKQAAQAIGFSKEQAEFLAVNTGNSSVGLLMKTKSSPAELRQQVASRGGTTEAALAVLHNGGSLEEAVKAALGRAEELSKGG